MVTTSAGRDESGIRESRDRETTVMVTGGSGYVGGEVVDGLAEWGHTVVSLYHHRLPQSRDGVFPVCSDMASPELLAAPLRGVDCVVHLAWQGGVVGPDTSWTWDPLGGGGESQNLTMLRSLIEAMERSGTRRIVFASALGASPDAASPFLREKYAAEFMILNSRIPEKVILRSSVVWGGTGGGDKFVRSMMRLLRYPFYPVPHRSQQIAPVHVEDVSDALVSACRDSMDQEPGLILELKGARTYRVEELLKLVSDRFVRKPRIPLGGVIGESLLPLFERESRQDPRIPCFQHFLALGNQTEEGLDVVERFRDLKRAEFPLEEGKPSPTDVETQKAG